MFGSVKDLGSLFKQAQQIQAKMDEFQSELSNLEVVGEAGGGTVSLTMNGKGVLQRVRMDPSLVKEEDVGILEDLIVAAHAAAKLKLDGMIAEKTQELAGGMPLPPGIDCFQGM